MEEDYVMIPGSGTKKIIRDVKKEIETACPATCPMCGTA